MSFVGARSNLFPKFNRGPKVQSGSLTKAALTLDGCVSRFGNPWYERLSKGVSNALIGEDGVY